MGKQVHPKFKKGLVVGKLTALEKLDMPPKGTRKWRWQCDCGNTADIIPNIVFRNVTKSCGCLRIPAVKRHFKDKGRPYKTKATGGYTYVFEPDHPNSATKGSAKGLILEHRFVMSTKLGRL